MALANAGSQLRSDICCTLMSNAPKDYSIGELIASVSCGHYSVKMPVGHPAADRILIPQSAPRDSSNVWRVTGIVLLGQKFDPR